MWGGNSQVSQDPPSCNPQAVVWSSETAAGVCVQGSVSRGGSHPARGHRDAFPGIPSALCTESCCENNPNPLTDPNSTAARDLWGCALLLDDSQLTPAATAASEPRPGSLSSLPGAGKALRHSYLLLRSPQWENAPCLRPQRRLEGSRRPPVKA